MSIQNSILIFEMYYLIFKNLTYDVTFIEVKRKIAL